MAPLLVPEEPELRVEDGVGDDEVEFVLGEDVSAVELVVVLFIPGFVNQSLTTSFVQAIGYRPFF